MTCYKRLIQLDKTIKSLEDAKEEIIKDFARNGNLICVKRMQNCDDNFGDRLIQSERRQQTSASKSLNFDNPRTNVSSGPSPDYIYHNHNAITDIKLVSTRLGH